MECDPEFVRHKGDYNMECSPPSTSDDEEDARQPVLIPLGRIVLDRLSEELLRRLRVPMQPDLAEALKIVSQGPNEGPSCSMDPIIPMQEAVCSSSHAIIGLSTSNESTASAGPAQAVKEDAPSSKAEECDAVAAESLNENFDEKINSLPEQDTDNEASEPKPSRANENPDPGNTQQAQKEDQLGTDCFEIPNKYAVETNPPGSKSETDYLPSRPNLENTCQAQDVGQLNGKHLKGPNQYFDEQKPSTSHGNNEDFPTVQKETRTYDIIRTSGTPPGVNDVVGPQYIDLTPENSYNLCPISDEESSKDSTVTIPVKVDRTPFRGFSLEPVENHKGKDNGPGRQMEHQQPYNIDNLLPLFQQADSLKCTQNSEVNNAHESFEDRQANANCPEVMNRPASVIVISEAQSTEHLLSDVLSEAHVWSEEELKTSPQLMTNELLQAWASKRNNGHETDTDVSGETRSDMSEVVLATASHIPCQNVMHLPKVQSSIQEQTVSSMILHSTISTKPSLSEEVIDVMSENSDPPQKIHEDNPALLPLDVHLSVDQVVTCSIEERPTIIRQQSIDILAAPPIYASANSASTAGLKNQIIQMEPIQSCPQKVSFYEAPSAIKQCGSAFLTCSSSPKTNLSETKKLESTQSGAALSPAMLKNQFDDFWDIEQKNISAGRTFLRSEQHQHQQNVRQPVAERPLVIQTSGHQQNCDEKIVTNDQNFWTGQEKTITRTSQFQTVPTVLVNGYEQLDPVTRQRMPESSQSASTGRLETTQIPPEGQRRESVLVQPQPQAQMRSFFDPRLLRPQEQLAILRGQQPNFEKSMSFSTPASRSVIKRSISEEAEIAADKTLRSDGRNGLWNAAQQLGIMENTENRSRTSSIPEPARSNQHFNSNLSQTQQSLPVMQHLPASIGTILKSAANKNKPSAFSGVNQDKEGQNAGQGFRLVSQGAVRPRYGANNNSSSVGRWDTSSPTEFSYTVANIPNLRPLSPICTSTGIPETSTIQAISGFASVLSNESRISKSKRKATIKPNVAAAKRPRRDALKEGQQHESMSTVKNPLNLFAANAPYISKLLQEQIGKQESYAGLNLGSLPATSSLGSLMAKTPNEKQQPLQCNYSAFRQLPSQVQPQAPSEPMQAAWYDAPGPSHQSPTQPQPVHHLPQSYGTQQYRGAFSSTQLMSQSMSHLMQQHPFSGPSTPQQPAIPSKPPEPAPVSQFGLPNITPGFGIPNVTPFTSNLLPMASRQQQYLPGITSQVDSVSQPLQQMKATLQPNQCRYPAPSAFQAANQSMVEVARPQCLHPSNSVFPSFNPYVLPILGLRLPTQLDRSKNLHQ